ncbi:efflux RND transporter periplasmic adaptor subunit [Aureimonas fodinaquatilis]|nr:efflux RND transporter periplasmic adaptor subunit [Aureimonas fodinaquatilis]
MAFIRQIFAALFVVCALALVSLWAFETPGRALLAYRDSLPSPLVSLVEAVSRGSETKISATPQRSRQNQATLVVTDIVRPDVTRDRLRTIGTGQAQRSVAIYPDATGLVQEINVRSGDAVEQGQVLATLRNSNETVAVQRARIALEAAQEQATRYQSLLRTGAVTTVQNDEVRRAVEAAALDLQSAEIALEDRNITAPISGRIGLVTLEPGALVSNQTLVATLDDRSQLKVVVEIPEAFVPQIALDHAVTAIPTTRTGKQYSGQISALDNRVDAASRTLRAEATVDNVADDLRPGMSFTVDIGFPGQQYLSVDALAVQWERSGPYVWVVSDGAVRKASVNIIERSVNRVLVSSTELAAGDAVVTEGLQQLREGAPVRQQNPAALPALPDEVPTVDRSPAASGDRAFLAQGDVPGQTRSATP